MNRSFKIFICLLLCSINVLAQNKRFITEGVIEFERSTNIYAIFSKRAAKSQNVWMTRIFDEIKKEGVQFKRSKSELYFNKSKTLFKPGEDTTPPIQFIGDEPSVSQINTIYMDLANHVQVSQKKVYDEQFLVKDSTRTINWKITDETREIAGYSCRRANALVLDSIYVVAFYTDEIPVSGGPESFSGLPGMILGLALPHENVTWFAKTVTDKPVASAMVVPPVKGKTVDRKGLIDTLTSVFKGWGTQINEIMKVYLL